MQQIDSHNHLSADRIVQLWKWKWLSELKAIDFPNNNIPPSHGRVSLTTVRAAGWAALTTCKYSQLSSLVGPFERFPTFVDRPDIFSSLKFSIYNMHNWEHLNLGLTEYQQRSWLSSQPVADEKILSSQLSSSPRPPWSRFAISKCNKPSRSKSVTTAGAPRRRRRGMWWKQGGGRTPAGTVLGGTTIWPPAILTLLWAAIFHVAAGIRLRQWCTRYCSADGLRGGEYNWGHPSRAKTCRVLMILKMRKYQMHCKTFDN